MNAQQCKQKSKFDYVAVTETDELAADQDKMWEQTSKARDIYAIKDGKTASLIQINWWS